MTSCTNVCASILSWYPLWAGIASQNQADRVVRNLSRFERPGGLQTSLRHTGDQWDAPFGWAPLQWIVVQALRRVSFARAYMLHYGHGHVTLPSALNGDPRRAEQ
jgi:neutral trehalase